MWRPHAIGTALGIAASPVAVALSVVVIVGFEVYERDPTKPMSSGMTLRWPRWRRRPIGIRIAIDAMTAL